MSEFERLVDVIGELRGDNGCPWDKEQTHESLKRYCIEEASEVIAGIDIMSETGNATNLCEELGDLLLQVVLHAQIAKEEGLFDIEDVAKSIADKMVRRHPHVFSDAKLESLDEVHETWEAVKKQEKSGKEWMEAYLPRAFSESEEYIQAARERKGLNRVDLKDK